MFIHTLSTSTTSFARKPSRRHWARDQLVLQDLEVHGILLLSEPVVGIHSTCPMAAGFFNHGRQFHLLHSIRTAQGYLKSTTPLAQGLGLKGLQVLPGQVRPLLGICRGLG